jgi:broad specificity phosphatase PhoE
MGTAMLAFKPLLLQGLKIVAYPDLREVGTGPASTGSSVEDIRAMLPERHYISDTSLVPEGWEKNCQDTSAQIKLRGNRVRRELWELGQQALKESGGKWKGYDVSRGSTHENIEIVVVSHGGFLRRMLGLNRKSELVEYEWKKLGTMLTYMQKNFIMRSGKLSNFLVV